MRLGFRSSDDHAFASFPFLDAAIPRFSTCMLHFVGNRFGSANVVDEQGWGTTHSMMGSIIVCTNHGSRYETTLTQAFPSNQMREKRGQLSSDPPQSGSWI